MRKYNILYYVLWFILGAGCFFLSQPLLRLQILNWIQGGTDYHLFALMNPVLTTVLIGLSAGVFEEGFRFLFKLTLLRPARSPMIQPVLFGLGHGLMEAFLILLPAVMGGYPLSSLWMGILERALTVVLHIGLTILVWNGFQKGKQLSYLAMAIGVHGLVDILLPLLMQTGFSALQVEIVYSVMVLGMLAYSLYSKKNYVYGGNPDETSLQSV